MITLAIAVFMLAGGGIYLLLDRRFYKAILGVSLLAHAANLIVLAGSARDHAVPALHDGSATASQGMADPLPQAMVLTAIVISMAITLYLLALLMAEAPAVDPAGSDDGER